MSVIALFVRCLQVKTPWQKDCIGAQGCRRARTPIQITEIGTAAVHVTANACMMRPKSPWTPPSRYHHIPKNRFTRAADARLCGDRLRASHRATKGQKGTTYMGRTLGERSRKTQPHRPQGTSMRRMPLMAMQMQQKNRNNNNRRLGNWTTKRT